VHLTGTYRAHSEHANSDDYYSIPYLIEDMKYVLYHSNVVISRCGMGSITELQYLMKPAYLIPLERSHQELNAEEVKDQFYILEQKESTHWMTTIQKTYPQWFKSIEYTSITSSQKQLTAYYDSIRSLHSN
jgi:UDP-N-acetylglucosamine:LPS N-acetylglucosamine transferase